MTLTVDYKQNGVGVGSDTDTVTVEGYKQMESGSKVTLTVQWSMARK